MLAGGAISWKSIKQSIVAQSLLEAKYIVVSFANREALWLSTFEQPLQLDTNSILIYGDNQGCLQISKDNILIKRTKHIEIKYQILMVIARIGYTRLEYVPSENNVFETMAKALTKTLITKFTSRMDVKRVTASIY